MTTLVVLHRICLAVQLVFAVWFVVEAVRWRSCCKQTAADLTAAVDRLEKVFKA